MSKQAVVHDMRKHSGLHVSTQSVNPNSSAKLITTVPHLQKRWWDAACALRRKGEAVGLLVEGCCEPDSEQVGPMLRSKIRENTTFFYALVSSSEQQKNDVACLPTRRLRGITWSHTYFGYLWWSAKVCMHETHSKECSASPGISGGKHLLRLPI